MDEAKRDELLIEIHGSVQALDERTKSLPNFMTKTVPELDNRVTKNETEVKWLKRILWAMVPSTGMGGGIIVAVMKFL